MAFFPLEIFPFFCLLLDRQLAKFRLQVGQNVPLFCLPGEALDSIELEEKIRLLVEAAGFRLLQMFWKPLRGRQMLRVIADAEDHNITVNECATLSRFISDLLDSYPHDFPDYRLEVSSPGLNHPLEAWQFPKNRGRLVEVRFAEKGKPQSWQGELQTVDEAGICVQGKEELRRFPFESIQQLYVLPRLSKSSAG